MLVAVPVPLVGVLLLAVFASPLVARVGAIVGLVTAALLAAGAARWCAERRVRQDVRRHAEELEHTKKQILALVSHELRTPVTGVVGFSRTLSGRIDDLDHDTMRLFVEAIDEHSNRLARLIDNVVVASRTPLIAVGANSRLSTALSRAIARIGLCPAQMQRVQISLDGVLEAHIDEEAAVRVMANLIDNALKFGDPDGIVSIEGQHDGDRVLLRIGNAGPAIALGLRSALYDPFVQGDPTDTRTADGLGLGLHVVRQLVEAYGGSIDLVDHPDLVVFQVSLRAARRPADLQSSSNGHATAAMVEASAPAPRHLAG